MAHDVFICHPSEDRATANAVVATLEADRVRCWIAPRDVLPSEEWAEAIVKAIGGSNLFVLVFSESSNRSSHVMREVEQAVGRGIPILPYRIEDVEPSPRLDYYIGGTHWLDALTPPLEAHLERLVETVRILLPRTDEEDLSHADDVAPDESVTELLPPVDIEPPLVSEDHSQQEYLPAGQAVVDIDPAKAEIPSSLGNESQPIPSEPALTRPTDAPDDEIIFPPDEWDVEVIALTDSQLGSLLKPEDPDPQPGEPSEAVVWTNLTPPGPASEALRDIVGQPTEELLDHPQPQSHPSEPTPPADSGGVRRRRAVAIGGAVLAAIFVVVAGFLVIRQLTGNAEVEVLGESITTPATGGPNPSASLAPVPISTSSTSTTSTTAAAPSDTGAKAQPSTATTIVTVPTTTAPAPPTTVATSPPTTVATAPPTTVAALVAVNDSYTRDDRSQVCFDVTANDSGSAPLTVVSVGGSEFGSASPSSCGVLYSPPDLDPRSDAFVDVISYTVKDATGATASATLTVSVR